MEDSQVRAGNVTRGHGMLEEFLAGQRARVANKLIPPEARDGRLLDIGCGCEPYFLARTAFARKWGVDKMVGRERDPAPTRHADIRLTNFDIDQGQRLPFEDGTCDQVTMLAVFEHIERTRLIALLDDIDRVLKPGGVYIMTTPAGWTGPILTLMKHLRLVSAVEINEHEDAYSRARIREVLGETSMRGHPVRFGSFECLMNTWMVIRKPLSSGE